MTEQAPEPKKGSSCSRIIIWVFRTLLVIVLGAALGVAIYYGAVLFYQNYVTVVQNNTRQIAGLDQRLGQVEALIKEQLTDLEVRLKTLEKTDRASQTSLEALPTLSAGLEAAQQAQSTALAALGELQARSTAAASQSAESASRLQALETALTGQQSENAQLKLEMLKLQAAQLLGRAATNLAEDNLGLAQQDIRAASDLLAAIPTETAPPEVKAALTYLTTALESLPQQPAAALEAVDHAWRLLTGGSSTTPPVGAGPQGTPVPLIQKQSSTHSGLAPSPASTEVPKPTIKPPPLDTPTNPVGPTLPPYPGPYPGP